MNKQHTGIIRKTICLFTLISSLLATTPNGWSQALTKIRDWTSTDGKVIHAELLVFEAGENSETVRLRLKGGAIVKLDLSRFNREDQALILKERLSTQFRMDFNKTKDSCFFYSKHLAEDDWHDRSWIYIGSGAKDSWLRLSIYSEPGFFSAGKAIIVVGKGVPVRIEYARDNIDSGRGPRSNYEGIDVLLTKQREDFLRALQSEDRLLLFLEPNEGDLQPIRLSKEEKQGLRATGRAFQTVTALSTDQTWWATLIGRNPDEFRAEEADPLKAWRKPDQKPLIPMRSWIDVQGEPKKAEVLGFEREKVIMRDSEGELFVMDTANFELADLELLTNKRLENSLYHSWHPIDDHNEYYWPVSWKTAQRFRRQVVLLAFKKDSQKPMLILQHLLAGSPELVPVSSELRSSEAASGLKITLGNSEKLRNSSGMNVWMPLDKLTTDILLDLSKKLKTFEYLLESLGGNKQSGKMSDEEFNASIEAIELYRMFDRRIVLSEKSEKVKPQPSETKPKGEAGTPQKKSL